MIEYKKILLVQTAFPGDIVLTTPFIKALKNLFPESYLTVITTPAGSVLLKGIKAIDSLIAYDKRGSDKGVLKLFALMRRLRKEDFDLCISPHLSARTALMIGATKAPIRIAYNEASLSFLYNRTVARDMNLHEVERILSLLEPLGVDTKGLDKTPSLEISAGSIRKGEQLFLGAGISPGERVIAVAPGSVWGTKRWSPEGYASLIDSLLAQYKAKVILVGSDAERETGDMILSHVHKKPVDLVGKTNLSELIAVLDRCVLLIGNDSAPGHIAAARSVPVVSIFGPTAPSFGYAPYGKNVQIVEKDIPCRPCHHHGPMNCPEGHFRCMRELTVDDVMGAVERTGALH